MGRARSRGLILSITSFPSVVVCDFLSLCSGADLGKGELILPNRIVEDLPLGNNIWLHDPVLDEFIPSCLESGLTGPLPFGNDARQASCPSCTFVGNTSQLAGLVDVGNQSLDGSTKKHIYPELIVSPMLILMLRALVEKILWF